jgi:hypothetical protein
VAEQDRPSLVHSCGAGILAAGACLDGVPAVVAFGSLALPWSQKHSVLFASTEACCCCCMCCCDVQGPPAAAGSTAVPHKGTTQATQAGPAAPTQRDTPFAAGAAAAVAAAAALCSREANTRRPAAAAVSLLGHPTQQQRFSRAFKPQDQGQQQEQEHQQGQQCRRGVWWS